MLLKKNMSRIFIDILDRDKLEVFKQLKVFSGGRYLVGGTALALQLGHRKSVDFDLFSNVNISPQDREEVVKIFGSGLRFTADNPDQLTFLTPRSVKVTFAYTPHRPLYKLITHQSLPLSLLSAPDIASDKAFTIGRRAVYRDYVDLYFIIQSGIPLSQIINDATQRYGALFSEKLFLEQLEYMGDLSSRQIEFVDKPRTFDEIHEFLHQQVRAHLIRKDAAI